MSATAPSPRPFGPYVLTRALGSDALGEVWRAGTAGASRLRPFLLVRTFAATSIDRPALLAAMETAVKLVDDVQGPAIAKGTVMGAIDDTPFVGTSYVEGRTLDHLLAVRLLGTPLPVEHGLLIAERLLAALESANAGRTHHGAAHGFLVPAFVCISNEGEARVFGHGLGAGLLPASATRARARASLRTSLPKSSRRGSRRPPETSTPSGAILFEALTGRAPPPGVALESVEGANLAVDGTPVPEDLRRLLRRALHPDPRVRDRSVSSFRRDLSALLYGGPVRALHVQPRVLPPEVLRQGDPAREARAGRRKRRSTRKRSRAPPVPAPAPAVEPLRRPAVEGSGSRRLESSTGSRRLPVPPARPPDAALRAPQPVPVRTVAGPMPKKALGGCAAVGRRRRRRPAPRGRRVLRAQTFRLAPPPMPTPAPVPTLAPPTPVPTPAPVVVGKEDPLFQAAVEKKLQEELKKREAKSAREQEAATKKRQAEIDKTSEEAVKSKDSEETARAAREQADREEATRLAREAMRAPQGRSAAGGGRGGGGRP